jgi:hypothetical protein
VALASGRQKEILAMRPKSLVKNSACLLLFASGALVPIFGASTPLGSVKQSTNATLSGRPLLPETLVFSDQVIQVGDGAALIAINDGSRLVLGKETVASLRQERGELAVLLNGGSLSIYHQSTSGTLRVKADDLSVVPESGFRTLGQVTVLNGTVVVSSKNGMLRVEGHGQPFEVRQGKTITIRQRSDRSPQVAAGSGRVRLSSVASWAGLGAGVLGTIAGFDALHRADDARTDAQNAANAASAAAQAAAAASSAASAATQAAAAAAALASAAAALGLEASNVVGCDLDKLAYSLGQPSPYKPSGGLKCP